MADVMEKARKTARQIGGKAVSTGKAALDQHLSVTGIKAAKKAVSGDYLGSAIEALTPPGVKVIKGVVKGFQSLFNHPEWYTNYPIKGMVGLNFGRRNSVNNNAFTMMGISSGSSDAVETTVASIEKVIFTIPKDEHLAFMQAVNILYAKIRSANSGNVNWTPAELALYILNVRSVRGALAQLRRTLACTYFGDPYDSDQPKLLTSISNGSEYNGTNYIGVNFETVTAHAADIQNNLVIWYSAVQNLLPINLPLYDRTDWMLSNIFRDSDDAKSNYTAFVAEYVPYYYINPSDGDIEMQTFYSLSPQSASSFEANYTTLMANMNSLINSVVNNPVNGIIAGDILKAFGTAAFYKQDAYPVGTPICPIYDEAALTQIQNATCLAVDLGSSTYGEELSIANNTHTITCTRPGTYEGWARKGATSVIVNSYKDDMSTGEMLSATRLCTLCTNDDSTSTYTITACGSEIVHNIKYYRSQAVAQQSYQTIGWNDFTNAVNLTDYQLINAWTIMNYSPLMLVANSSNSMVLFDFNNFAVAPRETVIDFHEYAILSLLYTIPTISRQREFTFLK